MQGGKKVAGETHTPIPPSTANEGRYVRMGQDVKTITQVELEDEYQLLLQDLPSQLTPNTIEHKAQRWEQYKQEKINKGESIGAYTAWSNRYNANMTKPQKSHEGVDEYWKTIGSWGKREVTVDTDVGKRRLDIADKNKQKGIEVKEYERGKVYATRDIKKECEMDGDLVDKGWDIEWVFKDCDLSKPLEDLLKSKNITIKKI